MALEFLVAEVFEVTGRGAVVAIDESTDLNVGKPHPVSIITPSGEQLKTQAYKDFMLRKDTMAEEKEAYTLAGLHKQDIPKGSVLRFEAE